MKIEVTNKTHFSARRYKTYYETSYIAMHPWINTQQKWEGECIDVNAIYLHRPVDDVNLTATWTLDKEEAEAVCNHYPFDFITGRNTYCSFKVVDGLMTVHWTNLKFEGQGDE